MSHYEIVLADADVDAARTWNRVPGLQEVDPPVDWGDTSMSPDGVQVAVPFEDEPEDREVECVMHELGATAACVRKTGDAPEASNPYAAKRPAPLPTCNHVPHVAGSTLVYQAHYGAPGIGWHAVCSECGADFSVVGDTAYDPAANAHELNPEDVI